MKLIAAAELAAGVNTYKVRPFVWRQSILRPAKRAKQASRTLENLKNPFGVCHGLGGFTHTDQT
jgi:hypothetical protein